MEIIIELIEENTLEEFADKHGLVMIIKERTPDIYNLPHIGGERGKFYASFKHVSVYQPPVLIGTHGNGATPEQAMIDYAKAISCKRLKYEPPNEECHKYFEAPHLRFK